MKVPFFLVISCCFFVVYALLLVFLSPLFVWVNIDPLSIVSLFLFLILILCATRSINYYLIILIVMIISFPSNVNNFFPGVFLGDVNERGANVFPVINHLDIYIIFGLCFFSSKFNYSQFYLRKTSLVILFIFASFLVNLLYNFFSVDWALLLVGSYQLRLFILLALFANIKIDEDTFLPIFINGIKLAVFFITLEAIVTTLVKDHTYLVSGTLGVNTFGNVMSAISLLFLGCFFYQKENRSFLLWSFSCLLISMLTGTRASLLAFFLGFLLFKFPFYKWNIKHVFFYFLIFFAYSVFAPYEYNVVKLISTDLLSEVFNSNSVDELASVRTIENSSILTRILLFRTSINMIIDSPFFGIGSGRWNYVKENFGFNISVLIDSHNGYLSLLSQYGIIGGTLLIFNLLIRPAFFYMKENVSRPIFLLGLFSLVMVFAEISNAGVFKMQVFAILSFISLMLLKYKVLVK